MCFLRKKKGIVFFLELIPLQDSTQSELHFESPKDKYYSLQLAVCFLVLN